MLFRKANNKMKRELNKHLYETPEKYDGAGLSGNRALAGPDDLLELSFHALEETGLLGGRFFLFRSYLLFLFSHNTL